LSSANLCQERLEAQKSEQSKEIAIATRWEIQRPLKKWETSYFEKILNGMFYRTSQYFNKKVLVFCPENSEKIVQIWKVIPC